MSNDIAHDPRIRPADAAGVGEAVRLLMEGALVALPTETVYGLAADAANPAAVAAIYAAKGRPAINPLIVHVSGPDMASHYGHFPPLARKLAAHFWPGPLTLVVERREEAAVAPAVTAGLPTIALRAPAHPAMQAVISGLGRGIAAPSANPSGRLSPTRAAHVAAGFGAQLALILDGGPARSGLESSIVAVTSDKAMLLRQGSIPAGELADVLGFVPELPTEGAKVQAPGMLLRHYAPRIPVRLNARSAAPDEFHIGFGPVAGDLNLSASGNLAEAAANLFDMLHKAEASGRRAIAIAPIPEDGIGAAIADRLHRAARG